MWIVLINPIDPNVDSPRFNFRASAICISGKRTHISVQSRPLWRINRAVHLTFAEERERFFLLLVILAITPSYEVKSSRHARRYIFFSRRILENNQ